MSELGKVLKRIIHLADYQIEARNSGNGNRYDEFRQSLEKVLTSIIMDNPEMIVITGDLYEFCFTTSAERKLQAWFLRELSKIATVVITNGNHDLKQKNNELLMDNKSVVGIDDIEDILDKMQINNIHYLKRTGFYDIDGVKFAVWGHYEKFNRVEDDQRPYSPWELDEATDKNPQEYIELFHDPYRGCKGFTSKPLQNFSNYKITLNDFKCPVVLAGDIHHPEIVRLPNMVFTYCSSTVMRHFGEGNKYRNGIMFQDGNHKHGYNLVEYDGTKDSKILFKKIEPIVSRHTIYLDDKFKYNELSLLDIDSTPMNLIRFEVESNVNLFFENQDKIYGYLKEKYNCLIEEPEFAKGVGIDFDDDYEIGEVEDILNDDKIIEMSNIYIDAAIDKTKTISSEDKVEAKKMLNNLFKEHFLSRVDTTNSLKKIYVKDIEISNALTFGDNVNVKFDRLGNIVRILGSNAVGKTKFYNIIGYMFNDVVDNGMRVNQLKNNRLEMFNYTRPNDTVHTKMNFDVNGLPHTIEKVLTRKWKRGKSMWDNEDWKSYIVGIPTLEIELTLPTGEKINDYKKVMEYMTDLITQDDFYTHLFVNQNTLSGLLKMKPDLLISQILKIIGLNFFDTLLEKYDDVKDRIMSGLVKPNGTIDSILNEISLKKVEIQNNIDFRKLINKEIDTINNESSVLRTELEECSEKVKMVESLSELNIKMSNSSDKISELKNSLTPVIENKEKLKNSLENIDVDKIKKNIETINEESDENISLTSKYKSELESLDTTKFNIEEELRNIEEKFKNDINIKVNKLNVEIIRNKDEITTNNKRLVEISKIVNSKLESLKEEHSKVLESKKNERDSKYNLYKTESDKNSRLVSENLIKISDLSALEVSIESLKKSKKCHKCSAFVDGDVEKSIKDSELRRDEVIIERDLSDNKVKESDKKLKTLKSDYNKANDEYTELNNKEIKYTILDDDILKSEVVEISKINKEIQNVKLVELKKQIDILENDDSYKNDEKFISLNEKLNNFKNNEESLLKSINSSKEIVDNNKIKITELRDKIELKGKIELAIVKYDSNLNSINKDIEIELNNLQSIESSILISKGFEDTFKRIDDIKLTLVKNDEIKSKKREDIIRDENVFKNLENDVILLEKDIQSLKKYTLTSAVVKQYKTMLGNNGLQKYLFTKIVDILNKKLSSLLEGVPMRLFFDKSSLELRKLDLNKKVISGVLLSSGMESSILGLSLLNSLKSLNQIRDYNFLFIDEISGQLNNGNGLSYKAENYENIFVKLLSKMKEHSCLYVVDHDIEDIGETSTLEFIPTQNGSIIELK